ncbi:MAG: PfkB family carbohydrate kinase [archaeon]|jgi:glucosamine-6-phosphate deaminase|nr:PfkB family carbohydrate kinase [archaeon]
MKRKLFSVGDLGLDLLQEIGKDLQFGEEHSLRSLDFSIGGNAANFAVIASKLGLKPVLISSIGKDFATSFLRRNLAESGVSSKFIKSPLPNSFSVIAVNRRGERAIQSVKNCLNEITAKKVEKILLPKLREQDIVFFGGFYHLTKLRPGFLPLLKKIKKKKAVICFDTCFDTTGKWDISKFLPFIDFLFVNDLELKHIARGSSLKERAKLLLRKGAGCVAVKQAAKGATVFTKPFGAVRSPSLAGKVVDTTAAGDAFNSGFVFGLMRNWSLNNCALAANFVAARKVREHGLASPKPTRVESFVKKNKQPLLAVKKNYREMSKAAASVVIELVKRKPDASLALATGETPKLLYFLLASAHKRGKVDFSRAKFFALDEYVGLGKSDRNSFGQYLMRKFLDKVNAKRQNTFLLNSLSRNLRGKCKRHEAAIKRRGIDLCILGVGRNGHVAFNEPGSSENSITRVVKLKPQTRKVNGKNFSSGLAPERALTIGLKTIRVNSMQILMLASGKNKRQAVKCMLKGKSVSRCPAATLQSHRNVAVLVDKAAVAK